jgi:hypothetical protein
MNELSLRPVTPLETLTEDVLLVRIAQWEAMRAFWIQALIENPHLVVRLDRRTRENLGFASVIAS